MKPAKALIAQNPAIYMDLAEECKARVEALQKTPKVLTTAGMGSEAAKRLDQVLL